MIQWSEWYNDPNDTMIQILLWSKWYYDPNDKMIHMIQMIWMKYKNKLVGSLKFPKCTQWSKWYNDLSDRIIWMIQCTKWFEWYNDQNGSVKKNER